MWFLSSQDPTGHLACVAGVSVRGKRGPREGGFCIWATRKMGRSKKVEGGGWRRGAKGKRFLRRPTFAS